MSARRLLLFRCAGRVFAVDADVAREILPLQPATRIPGAAPAVVGLVNVRGLLVTVIDAAAAMDGAGGAASGVGAMVRLDVGAHRVGLVVDEVLDLVVADDAELDDRAALPGVRPDLVRAVGTAAGVPFVELAISALLEPLLT